METVLLIALVGFINISCFIVGAKVGQAVAKDEKVELPTINPLELIRERENKREAQKEQDKVNAILQNVESYNGTSQGQRDIPR